MIILGIDPGTRITGYGIIDKHERGIGHIAHGEIKNSKGILLSSRLKKIFDSLTEVIQEYRPNVVAIEDIFYGKNIKSLIKQGHARGAAILVAPINNLPVHEYSPLEIKQAVVGYGRAEKRQVQHMVKAILCLPDLPPPDAADALAAAICHANFLKTETF